MILSLANSIRFVVNNGLDPGFNNTLFADESFGNLRDREYCQKYLNGDTLLVQIKGTLTETVTLTRYNSDNTTSVVSVTNTYTYTTYKVYDYEITLSTGDHFYLIATSDASGEDSWTSEPVEVTDRDNMLKIQWYGYDPELTFEYDYTNDEVNLMYIEARLLNYTPGGETTIYDNQNEKTKIKQSVFRTLTLETAELPRYMAEKLQIAMAHDVFVVNDVQYVAEEMEEVQPIGGNMTTISATLTESNVLGLNTDDLGFDCDNITTEDMIINLVKLNGVGQFSFTLTAGYSINQILVDYQDGTSVKFKAGWTVGGEEIVREFTVPTSEIYTIDRELGKSASVDKTIYCEVSGTNALVNVYIQTIKYVS